MAKVAPFHSDQNPGIYHVCSKCTEGLNIQLGNRRQGRGYGRLCYRCKALQGSDNC